MSEGLRHTLAHARLLAAAELRMQVRQGLAIALVAVLPIVGVPLGLVAAEAYSGTVDEIQAAAGPISNPDKPKDTLPVAVPPEAVEWLLAPDGLVAVPPGPEALAELVLTDGGRTAKILYTPKLSSNQAKARLQRSLDRRRGRLRAAAFDAAGMVPLKSDGLGWRVTDVAAAQSKGGALIVPLAMLAMLMTAAYTALDVLTGERERGTLETLLVSPADRLAVLLSKTAVVTGLAVATGWLALAGVVVGARAGLRGVPDLGPGALIGVAAALAVLAVTVSAISVLLATLATTYRSASLAMSGAMLIALLPSGLGTMSVELTPVMAIVPIGHVALAVRDGVAGTLAAGDALLVALTSLGWAGLAVAVAGVWVVRDDALLHVPDPLALRREGFHGREAAGLFALALLLVWLLGGAAQAIDLPSGHLFTQVAIIALVGVCGVAWVGSPLADTLSLRAPSARDLGLALVAGFAAPAIGLAVGLAQSAVLPIPRALVDGMALASDRPLWARLALFALTPALCEELLFRGAILGLMRRTPVVARVAANAAMFGLMHLSIHRLLPTAALGVLLAAAAVRSRSIAPAMVIHFVNNTLAFTALASMVDSAGGAPVSAPALAGIAVGACVSVGAVAAMSGPGRR